MSDQQKPIVSYQEFAKLDLRVGLVVEAEIPSWSNSLIKMKIDFGEEIGMRTICAGVKEHYAPEDLLNRKFAFVVNLAEKQMGKAVSQGMMLMAVDEDDRPIKIEVSEDAPVGCTIC
ncbi:MAG: Methionine--tRNA ligase [Microgenomates bacterium 39_7]|nr:MAG: Methionine--tRNA ligase [Microgenomates bacterium 39_7]